VSISPNVVWHPTSPDRWGRAPAGGATLWFTGLPSAGKSTLAVAVRDRLAGEGVSAYVLDGDNLRHGLNGDLGFDGPARAENVRRTAHVARLFADAGLVVLVSLVSPYATDRALARGLHEAADLPFVEVFVNAPLAVCEERDPKGLYARARRGELPGLTGIDDPYEPPVAPDVEILPAPLECNVETVCAVLATRLTKPD
jgi:bifunctional enzyme CysN/CysC